MADSGDEGSGDEGLGFTGFLFGNIDDKGKLDKDSDLFDDESKAHLAALQKLGFGSFIKEVVSDADDANHSEACDASSSGGRNRRHDGESSEDDDDFLFDDHDDEYDRPARDNVGNLSPSKKKPKSSDLESNGAGPIQKLPDAVDFFDMEELADEDQRGQNDSLLMPPPPPRTGFGRGSSECFSGDDWPHKLNTPLAAMLPSKYADRNVTELFPEFRPNKVLRFSRLFGPGKPSSLPQIWRAVKKKRRRKPMHSISESSSSPTPLDEEEPREPYEWKFDFAPPPPADQLQDNEAEFLRPMELANGRDSMGRKKDAAVTSIAPWRYGPAQLWFDIMDVPDSGDGFTYGFKLKKRQKSHKSLRRPGRGGMRRLDVSQRNGDGDSTDSDEEDSKKKLPGLKTEGDSLFADESFFMVNQINWEDDVIWNGDEVKHKVMQKLQSKPNAAGWIPSSMMRTAQSLTLSQPVKGATGAPVPSTSASALKGGKLANSILVQDDGDDTWYSIFPVENEELIYKRWEDDVIWDAENMDRIPEPKVVTLDPNDENVILGIPDDIDPSTGESTEQVRTKTKIPHPHVRKSKMLLGKAGVIHQIEEDSPPPPPKSPDKDPYNISNDEYYMPKAEPNLKSTVSSTLIQHSIPVVELRAPFVPTHLGPVRLRAFHRPAMKRYSHGPLAQPAEHPVHYLADEIEKKAQEREQERLASGGGEVFFMRTPDDLTAKDGELIFCEYSEEHPPLIMQVGMCTKLKNYYKRRAVKDRGPPEYKYGETAYAHTSPFLGHMHPGQSIQTLENNLFRAPMYKHPPPKTDFLLIRTRNGYYLRDVESLYCVGQECPLYEVPGPNSKRANNFVRDFLQVFIYRLFWSSSDTPRRIRMDDIKRAFPSHSESSIRKRLKLCADFKRTGTDSNWWVQRPDFRLPTEEELRALVSPEQCCAYFSMIAAEQRLRDAGYGEKFLLIAQDDDDEDMQMKMEDEVKVAPWNTTRAYIQAAKAKCLLQLTGPADPTGCGEGFSYIRVPNKPQQNKEEVVQEKRTVTGTDADLRRLSLRDAKALLRKFDVPEEEIKKLSRWEVIDVVRTLSTEKAKAGEEGMTKFSRGNRFSIAEHQERYKEECQRIFDLQNKVLSSSEILSSDEASSSDEDNSDMEDMSKNLEKMLTNKKTSSQLTREREEQERRELRRMMMEESSKKKSTVAVNEESQEPPNLTGRKLRITRTFRKANGDLFSRTEIVRNPAVIDAYVKIRQTKDEAFIRQFATPDDAQKEEMKREKRRIQEQLRRIKKNQERGAGRLSDGGDEGGSRDGSSRMDMSFTSDRTSSPLPGPSTSSGTGGPFSAFAQPSTSGLTSSAKKKKREEREPKESKAAKLKPDLKLKCGACGQVGHMRTNKACPLYTGPGATGNVPPVPVAMTEQQMEAELENNVFKEDEQLVNVEGTKVTFSSNLIKQAEELKRKSLLLKFPKKSVDTAGPSTAPALPPSNPAPALPPPAPVSPREPTPPPTQFSQFFQPMSSEPKGQPPKKKRRVANENLDYLSRVKKPAQRRRIDPLVAVSTVFEEILKEMSNAREAMQFLYPVSAKLVPDYYRIISQPMDLQKMKENNRTRVYQSREDFLQDASLIVHNSSLYNGPNHPLTHDAQSLLKICIQRLSEQEQKLMDLEKSINPLLDDNSKVALSFLLGSILQNKIKVLPDSYPFHKPVNKKNVKDYFSIIDQPMDLETIEKKIKEHKYLTGRAFLRDMEQIYLNSSKYNGEASLFTQQAKVLVEVAKSTLAKYQEPLNELERKIRAAAASDTGASTMDDDSSDSEFEDADDELSHASGSHTLKSELIIKDDPEAGPSGLDTSDYFGGHHAGDEMDIEDSYDPEAQLLLEFGGPRHLEGGISHSTMDSAFEDARSSFDDSQDSRQHASQGSVDSDVWSGISF